RGNRCAGVNDGKLCEVAYTILRGYVDSSFPLAPRKPSNFVDACRQLEQADKTKFSQAVRITIPRMLVSLYEIRNNRGVGHVGGDVDPNPMDAAVVLACAKWIMAEMVRHFHQVDVTTATKMVEALIERTNPLVWEVGDVRRVLKPGMSMKDKVLVLLHSSSSPLHEDQLVSWVEHSNKSVFRRDVLRQLHREKLIEYDQTSKTASLSPLGVSYVEEPAPGPKAAAPPGGPVADAGRGARRGRRGRVPRRVREPVPLQPRVPAAVRRPAAPGRGRAQGRTPPMNHSRFQRRGALTG